MSFKSNAEQLNIELNLITESVHQGIVNMSNETRDYMTLVEQAQLGIQTLMDKTGMSATSAIAKIKDINSQMISLRADLKESGASLAGVPQSMNPTLLNSALRDAENIRKGGLATINSEVQAENKLDELQLKKNLYNQKEVDLLVEKVTQKRAETQVDESNIAFEKLKTLELEKQLQLQTGMNAEQRAITAGRIPLGSVNMQQANLENVAFDVSKFVGNNGLVPQLNSVTTAMQNIKATNPSVTFDEIGNSMKKAGVNADTVRKGVDQLEPAAKRAGGGFNILRTAMGFLSAMAMSAIIQGITSTINKMIDSVKQAEKAVFNLAIAEKALSRAGIEISPKDFKDMADAVRATGIALSDIDIDKLIANTASGTVDLKLNVKQLKDLSVATAAIAYSNGKTVEEVQNTIQTSLTTSGRGLKALDIPVDALIIKEKAINSHLVANEAAFNALTAAEKQQVEVDALLLIISDKKNQILAETDKLNGGLTESTTKMAASWENWTTAAGKLFAPILIGGSQLITQLLDIEVAYKKFQVSFMNEFVARLIGNSGLIKETLAGNVKSIEDAATAWNKYYQIGLITLNKDNTAANEPTAPKDQSKVVDQNLLDAEKKFNQEILDAQLKLGQDLENAEIDYQRKRYDIGVEYAAKRADLEKEYANKVTDINTSYAQTIADINQKQKDEKAKARVDELQREREFQNAMLVLKENFLMALDDALHARDARQILKLIKNYELDKAQAERKHALDTKSAAEAEALQQKSFDQERKKAEADRKAKLLAAQQDYNDKVAKLKADEAAAYEAARLDNQRKIEDLNKANTDRLAIIAAGLVAEFNLTEDNLKNIVNLYKKYYSDATGILAAMRAQLNGTMAMGGATLKAGSAINSGMIQYSAPIGPTMSGGNLPSTSLINTNKPTTGGGGGGFKKAEGGSIIANKSTNVTFGEAGPEVATFMPLGRVGKDINTVMSNMSGSGNSSGKISIEMLLSPDLEARIVSNTLNKTADVFTKIQRAKR